MGGSGWRKPVIAAQARVVTARQLQVVQDCCTQLVHFERATLGQGYRDVGGGEGSQAQMGVQCEGVEVLVGGRDALELKKK